jgi:hypothetical protein
MDVGDIFPAMFWNVAVAFEKHGGSTNDSWMVRTKTLSKSPNFIDTRLLPKGTFTALGLFGIFGNFASVGVESISMESMV